MIITIPCGILKLPINCFQKFKQSWDAYQARKLLPVLITDKIMTAKVSPIKTIEMSNVVIVKPTYIPFKNNNISKAKAKKLPIYKVEPIVNV